MRKTLGVIAALTLGLILALTQVTAAFEVSPGVAYQIGDFTYSLLSEGEALYTCSVPQPAIVWTADAARGSFVGSAFYGKRGLGPAEPDPEWWDIEEGGEAEAVGASEMLGVDLGYRLSLGSFTAIPTIGYRRAQSWTGFTGTGDGEEGEWTEGFGLEIAGYRAGAEGSVPLGARISLKGEIGFGVGTHARGVGVGLYRDPETGRSDEYCYYEDLSDQTARSSDYSIGLAYEFSDCLSIEAGYRASSGSVTFVSDLGDSLSFGSSAFFVKGTASF